MFLAKVNASTIVYFACDRGESESDAIHVSFIIHFHISQRFVTAQRSSFVTSLCT